MNERIRDLGIQAGLYVDLNGTPWPRAMSAEACEAAYKKFADMIVAECADIAKHHVMNISTYGDAEFVDEQIRDHFGVEE
jgi:hypothetical protein